MTIEQIVNTINGYAWGLPLIVLVIGTGIILTIVTKAFQFRRLPFILKSTLGQMISGRSGKRGAVGEGKKGILSSLQAVSTAVGGSVGVGNIGGVATAIAVGGPGAVFWLWIAGVFGMLIKMVEVTLSVYYRKTDNEGNPYGGPTYYIESGIGKQLGLRFWKPLAIIFGIGIYFPLIITVQNYTVAQAISSTLPVFHPIAVGVATALIGLIIVLTGIKGIGRVAGLLVPFMCLFYMLAGLIIILLNIGNLPATIGMIINGAFNGTAAVGGFTGAGVMMVLRTGVARSVYSNEAGWGTSPMIHSTAKTDHPIRQGLWGAFEVFVDTILVCTTTAIIILITGVWDSGKTGADLTLSAFEIGMGSISRYIICTAIFLFAITTAIGWYTYYEVVARHLLWRHPVARDRLLLGVKLIQAFPGVSMTIWAYNYGVPGGAVWALGDLSAALPIFINLLVILMLTPTFLKLLKDFNARHLGIGKVEAGFQPFYEDSAAAGED